jgi:hypothetical protein
MSNVRFMAPHRGSPAPHWSSGLLEWVYCTLLSGIRDGANPNSDEKSFGGENRAVSQIIVTESSTTLVISKNGSPRELPRNLIGNEHLMWSLFRLQVRNYSQKCILSANHTILLCVSKGNERYMGISRAYPRNGRRNDELKGRQGMSVIRGFTGTTDREFACWSTKCSFESIIDICREWSCD